jgi:hypothetical protein
MEHMILSACPFCNRQFMLHGYFRFAEFTHNCVECHNILNINVNDKYFFVNKIFVGLVEESG